MTMAADARPVVYPARECSHVDGRPKVGYPSRRIALAVRRKVRVKDQHVYACACGAWHLGHRP
jgi:hypothetical protein